MNIQFHIMCLLLFMCAGGCIKSGDESEVNHPAQVDPLSNLKEQSRRMLNAGIRGDDEKFADYIVPTLIQKVGGRQRLIEGAKTMRDDLKRRGFRMVGFRFSSSPRIRTSGDVMFAVVPYVSEMTGPNGRSGTNPTALIGISKDKGKTWRFSRAIGDDPKTLQEIMPGFPADLPIPKKERATWSKPKSR